MNIVTSWFIARKTPNMEPVQVLMEPQNTLKRRSKNDPYVIVHICLGIKKYKYKKKKYSRIKVAKQSTS